MSKIYKKQPLDIVVSGITLRYSMKYNIWVNWAGTRAYRKYNDSSWNRFLQIHTDINGSKFLNVKPKTVQLDEAVADAYNPMPDDGKKYKLVHNDGNLGNCQANNLEWKEVRKYDPLATRRKIGNGLTVTVEGKIFDKGKELPIEKETGDRDTDRMVAISTMQRPRVLHKNMNYLDYHADNLEWVEESSPEYQEYIKRKKEDIDKLTKELNWNNPNFKLPDNQ